MTSATESLKGLHQIHQQLEQDRDELARGPRTIAARKKMLEQKKADLQAFQDSIKQIKMASDRKSLDLKTLEKKLEDLKGKLNTANSNREYDIISGQIKADEMAKSVMEDEIIELYEKIEEEAAKVPEMDQAVNTYEQDLEKFREEFQSRIQELEKHIHSLEQDLKSAEKILPSEPAEKYRRLVASKGSRALAAVNNGSCSNCFVALTAQQKILIKSDNFLFCTNCGSMLYLNE